MQTNNAPSVNNTEQQDWPQQPSGILIMGKRQGTKKANKQLWGRAALAAALWYSAPQPKPYLIFVASDVHGPQQKPDAEVVKSLLTNNFEISSDFVITRQKSNCTFLEVRALQAISRAYRLSEVFAITHLYHAPRSQRYLDEVIADGSVIPVHPDILDEINFPLDAFDLLVEIKAMVENSMPGRWDKAREHVIEWILGRAHTVDPKGRLERWLAKRLRPRAYR